MIREEPDDNGGFVDTDADPIQEITKDPYSSNPGAFQSIKHYSKEL